MKRIARAGEAMRTEVVKRFALAILLCTGIAAQSATARAACESFGESLWVQVDGDEGSGTGGTGFGGGFGGDEEIGRAHV